MNRVVALLCVSPRRVNALVVQFLAIGCILLFATNVGVAQDIDGDGMINAFDNAPTLFNPSQLDTDNDDVGDVADPDIDADGLVNGEDNAALTFNPGQPDTDGDEWGDAIDPDIDHPMVPGTVFMAELNGPYQYVPTVDNFVFLSAVGSDDPIGSYFLQLSLDLDNDGQYDDLTQFGPSSLMLSLDTLQLHSFGLDQPGQHIIGLMVSGLQGSATDSAFLNVVLALPGDFDFDDDVDGADLLAWQRGEASDPPSAEDLGLWREQFGATQALSATATIPEPTTILLAMSGVASVCCWRRRRLYHTTTTDRLRKGIFGFLP